MPTISKKEIDYKKVEQKCRKTDHESEEKVKSIERDLKRAKKALGSNQFVLSIFDNIRKPKSDPGKYGVAYFCRDRLGQPALPAELLSSEQADTAIKNHYKVVPWAEMETTHCPSCDSEHPLILEHDQTYDGPDGDTWQLRTMVICTKAIGAHVLTEHSSDSRLV